ncbi:hypothetical protein, partial [Paraburkholderia kirstenboschensis]|uniref:hypothetical protein n=1 Tax=Paraburkholderia kirstenboschensis TaxID=1245436 RepID=UPI000AEEA679
TPRDRPRAIRVRRRCSERAPNSTTFIEFGATQVREFTSTIEAMTQKIYGGLLQDAGPLSRAAWRRGTSTIQTEGAVRNLSEDN